MSQERSLEESFDPDPIPQHPRPGILSTFALSIAAFTVAAAINYSFDPINRTICFLSRTSYTEFKANQAEHFERSRRMPTDEFFGRYDTDGNGLINPTEYNTSLPPNMQSSK